jgi:hypothetical protein
MNVKAVLWWALVVTVLGASAAWAEEVPPSTTTPPLAPKVQGLSDWITYTRPDCCGPIGRNGPIGYELYTRTGWSIPTGGPIFHQGIESGWTIAAGARLLFFNTEADAAWTFDLGLLHSYNHGQRDDLPITLFIRDNTINPITMQLQNPGTFIQRDVTVRSLHRTYVQLLFGREWYLTGAPDGCHWNWRAGFDAGGRYGSMRADLDEFRMRSYFRRNDVIGGLLLALHSDVEIPCGCCTFIGGLRLEYGYTWSDIFQVQNDSDLQEVNLLVNLGVRF